MTATTTPSERRFADRAFVRVVQSLPFAIALIVACVPSDFDNISSGGPLPDGGVPPGPLPPDSTLKPPRPVAPLSGSWTNSLRPTLRWEHGIESGFGAHIEMCRKVIVVEGARRCDGDKKIFEATGLSVAIQEDLAPGIWFWQLATRTTGAVGTELSVPWTVLVRGGAGNGGAHGNIVDVNGDGRADLVITADTVEPAGGVEVLPLLATNDDSTAFAYDPTDGNDFVFGVGANPNDPHNFAMTDWNGDGLTDIVFTSKYSPDQSLATLRGTATPSFGNVFADDFRVIDVLPIDALPTMFSIGDIDGDGYGDVAFSTKINASILFGAREQIGITSPLILIDPSQPADSGAPQPLPYNIPLATGFDRQNDGVSDFAMPAFGSGDIPLLALIEGTTNRGTNTFIPIFATNTPLPTPAQAFATGDFDADGNGDVVFLTTVDAKPSLCIVLAAKVDPDAGADISLPCFTPPDPLPAGFATSMVAADLEGDGTDEVLVATTSNGVYVVSFKDGVLSGSLLTTEFGASVTTLLPGRPGPATWAATKADGTAIAIFKGRDVAKTLTPRPIWKRFGLAIR